MHMGRRKEIVKRPRRNFGQCIGPECPRHAIVKVHMLCDQHYRQFQRGEELLPLHLQDVNGKSPQDRLLFRRRLQGDCWCWTGHCNAKGYGKIFVDGKSRDVHSLAYELWVGPRTPGLSIDHLCRVRSCFNPEHLEEVTIRENVLRMHQRYNDLEKENERLRAEIRLLLADQLENAWVLSGLKEAS